MAKLKMKKVCIAALRSDRKRLIEHLQDSALIQIESETEAQEGFSRPDTLSQAQIFEKNALLTEQALTILNRLAPEKAGLLASFAGRRPVDPDEIGAIAAKAGERIEICRKIVALNNRCAENAAELVRVRTSLAQLEPWEKLDIPFSLQGTDQTAVFIGSLPGGYTEETLAAAVAEEAPDLAFAFEILSGGKEQTCVTFCAMKAQEELAEKALSALSFARPFDAGDLLPAEEKKRLEAAAESLTADSERCKKEIVTYAKERQALQEIQDYFRIRADKYTVIGQLDHSAHTFLITGYVPEEDCDKVTALCNRVAPCVVEFSDAEEETAPVKLKNNKFAAPAQSIVNMYAAPAAGDIDPSPILAFFYYFFFGMMFSDAGYGLLMIFATAFLIKKYKPEESMRLNLKLFQYCGVSTFLWGLVFGSFFGDAPAALYNHFAGADITMAQLLPWPILDPQKDALTLMIVSIAFGLIHILVGMGCKFYICWKRKDYKAALYDTGLWMLLLIGFALLAAGMATTKIVMYVGIALAAASAAGLVLTQGRSKKGVGRVVGGIASLYDVTGYISDLLSYTRLLALGLTTGVMAQVFNMLSTMFGTSIPSFIPMLLIFVFGHLINIGLNALGSYVHTMRLQYVELFSKFYEGGGKPFQPFTLNSKYIRIQEETKK